MSGYKFERIEKNKFGDGIAFYINNQLPSRIIKNWESFRHWDSDYKNNNTQK